ncbi:MAG: HAMP domain-containing protein [Gammaproteobacteria bacterium]|nr:HAMP domain-containing protein [Gammaproteobacteria bacterium]
MTRLFLHLFGTIFLVVLLSAIASVLLYRAFDDSPQRRIPDPTLDAWADEAIRGLPLGRRALNERLQGMGETVNVSMTLIMPDGEQYGRPVSARVVHTMRNELTDMLEKEGQINDTVSWRMGSRIHALRLVKFGPRYIGFLVSWIENPESELRMRMWMGATLFGIAVAALLLAWRIESPIRRLQRTARAIGQGDLSARPPNLIMQRRDAIGDLSQTMARMAQDIDDLVANQRQLIRDISHELRTPLARIQVALALVEKKGTQTMLPRIEAELVKLDGLIGEVLALARMESGKDDLEHSPINLAQMLEDIADDASFEFKPRRAKTSLTTQCTLLGDPDWLRRAIENVVRNAFKYSKQGDVDISLTRMGPSVIIAISDRGPGVAECELEGLFEPFTRGNTARTHDGESEGGYGVGLAITRSVIKRHGGQVKAKCREGGGLTVEISLPG